MLQLWKRACTGRAKAFVISLGLFHALTLSWAATFTVNSAADGADAAPGNGVCATAAGVCTLRAAVQEANALAGADTVTFSLPAGATITLTAAAGGAINVTSDLVIRGPTVTNPAAQLRVSGGWDGVINSGVGSRVFFLPAAAGRSSVTISDLALINGNAGTETGGANPGVPRSNGGAIYVEGGTLTLERMTFSNSTSNDGGALEVENATVNISDSSFSGNKARDDGGALDIGDAPAAVNVTNTTFANNRSEAGTAAGLGGTGGAVRVDGHLSLTYVTMAYNVGARGGGIDLASTGSVSFRNSLIFDNKELSGTVRNCVTNNESTRPVASARTDSGNNWTNTSDSCALGNTITAPSLALAPALGSNGGPTQTLSLASSSGVNGVIPAGSNCGAGVGLKDQRGVARAVYGGCEPGAFELQGAPNLTLSKSHTGAFVRGGTGTYTLRVTNVGTGATAGTVTLSDTLPTGLSYRAATGNGWTVSVSGSTVTATRADALAANVSFPDLTLSVNVLSSAPDTLTNSATVSGGGDTTPGNNTATDPTTVTAAGTLMLGKVVRNVTQGGGFGESGVGAPGDVLEYRITFTARGNTLYDVIVRDNVPVSTRLVQNSYGATGEVELTCPDNSVVNIDLNGVTNGTLNLAVTEPGRCVNSLAPDGFGYLKFRVLIQ